MIGSLKGKTVSVLGLGISNIPLVHCLLDEGAIITARDRKDYTLISAEIKELEENGVKLICGEGYLDNITDEYIFRSPGLRYDKPEIQKAVDNGSVLTSEMELFFERCPAHIIAVTGSDGKTTTTTLISKMIEAQFGRAFVGGNIGAPLLPQVKKMKEDDWAVLELSSFQLHTMKQSPEIAVITNLSPNHLDYHTDMQEYIDAKKNIFRHMKGKTKLILNYGNELTRNLASEKSEGTEVLFFAGDEGVCEKDGSIYCKGEEILKCSDILLPGHHNTENYMAAIGAVYPIVSKEVIVKLAKSFGGVEHRLELVRIKDGVGYYNSSIDSSPTRTAAALSAFDSKVIAICGGYDKHIPFEPLARTLIFGAKTVVLTGATAQKIKTVITECEAYKDGMPKIIMEADFESAVRKAAADAQDGDNVVLSPACASFDAFANFMERGNKFKEIINSL